jgi:SAM-dependent MidA family methyltransferase
MSTAYHPVTNEQTERTNQSLKQYLRHYVNNIQNNWVSLLSMAQLTLNAKISDTTKVTSFFANFGKEPNLFGRERNHLAAQSAIERIATLKKIHDNITSMQIRSTKYQNKKRKMAP